jgi:hypothetical protein
MLASDLHLRSPRQSNLLVYIRSLCIACPQGMCCMSHAGEGHLLHLRVQAFAKRQLTSCPTTACRQPGVQLLYNQHRSPLSARSNSNLCDTSPLSLTLRQSTHLSRGTTPRSSQLRPAFGRRSVSTMAPEPDNKVPKPPKRIVVCCDGKAISSMPNLTNDTRRHLGQLRLRLR